MTTENTAAGTEPAATHASVETTVTKAAEAVAKAASDDAVDPSWLKTRLERERTKALKDVGFSSSEEAKSAADAVKAKAESEKAAETRAAELKAQLEGETKSKTAAMAVLNEMAARMKVGLSAEQKAAVEKLAGEDPVKVLETINALAPTWAANEAAAKAAAEKAAPGATTAPVAGAPNGNAPAKSAPRATYEQMAATNPFAAAEFGVENPTVYTPK